MKIVGDFDSNFFLLVIKNFGGEEGEEDEEDEEKLCLVIDEEYFYD